MFELLGSLSDWVLQFFPRLLVIRSTHRVVKFVRGSKLVLAGPGLCWYWPLVTEISMMAVARRTINLPTQRLVTRDGVRVMVSAYVVFSVNDPIKAIGRTWDFDEAIADVSAGAIASIVSRRVFQVTKDTLAGTTADQLKEACKTELQKYGVLVHRCQFTDFCEAEVIALSHSGEISRMLAEEVE